MNCLYCQAATLEYSPNDNRSSFLCQNCNARFQCICGAISCITWSDIIIGDKHYSVKLYPDPMLTGNAPMFVVYYAIIETSLSGIPIYNWQDLLRFDFIPQGWTPQNIKEKIKHHLVYL